MATLYITIELSWKLHEYVDLSKVEGDPLREEKEKKKLFRDSSSREAVLPGVDTGLIINKRVTRINGPLISGRPNVDLSSFDYYTDSMRSISCDNIYIYITFVLFITLKRAREVPESQSVTLLSLLDDVRASRILSR